LQKRTRKAHALIIGRSLLWMTVRICGLIIFFVLLETSYRAGLFTLFGTAENQLIAYAISQKILFSLIVWFFLSIAKRMIIPATIVTISPAIAKVCRDPKSRQKTVKSTRKYITYLVYLIALIALILIWAYSFLGTWVSGVLGTGLIVTMTFVFGLFTSSVLGNVLAYTVLSGSDELKKGDRVQIGESYGDIEEVGLFFTRIRTIKDEMISVPNLSVMGKEIKNFSALKKVLIYASITLGYDVDKDQAKKILIESAEKTDGIITSKENKPFVLLRDLGNFTITYEINAYTNKPNMLIRIKSDLIDNILTGFKKSGIEILSPSHFVIRQEHSHNTISLKQQKNADYIIAQEYETGLPMYDDRGKIFRKTK
jgi:small-conductance mechanosensitive channel